MQKRLEEEENQQLQNTYGEGYFRGVNSGYPGSGYEHGHPDWDAWLDIIYRLRPEGCVVDLGCAFGFLVGKAKAKGYNAFGLDISRYALEQEAALRGSLIQARAERVPLKGGAADVVTVFDVIEHLVSPGLCLDEARRVLHPEGLLIGATPDPIYFEGEEETHVFERPPSYWIRELELRGFRVVCRFSDVPYNFQFVAAHRESELAGKLDLFQHDFVGGEADILEFRGELSALLRSGWGAKREDRRTLSGSSASVYLLNRHFDPQRMRVQLSFDQSPFFSTLRVRLDSYVLKEVFLTSEKTSHEVSLDDVLVPSGGHHLFFDISPGGPQIEFSKIQISSEPASSEELARGLPFDLYQRYRAAGRLCSEVRAHKILDIGGFLGDQSGHIATPRDLLAPDSDFPVEVSSTDFRQCDLPSHQPAVGWEQPFGDGSFDFVLTLDVLEHISSDQRETFLGEMDRLSTDWILIGAPFAAPEVVEAEVTLRGGLLKGHSFLEEHEEFGLPEKDLIRQFYGTSRGYQVLEFPNGYIPRWVELQTLTHFYFSVRDYEVTRSFNRLYNEYFEAADSREPAYRTLFLICKTPLDPLKASGLLKSRSGRRNEEELRRRLSHDSAFPLMFRRILDLESEREKAGQDCQFLVNARQRLVEMLQEESTQLRQIRSQLELTAEQLREERRHLLDEGKALRIETSIRNQEIENLRQEVERLRPEVEKLRPEVERLRNELAAVVRDRDGLRSATEEAERERSALQQEHASLVREYRAVAAELEAVRRVYAELTLGYEQLANDKELLLRDLNQTPLRKMAVRRLRRKVRATLGKAENK